VVPLSVSLLFRKRAAARIRPSSVALGLPGPESRAAARVAGSLCGGFSCAVPVAILLSARKGSAPPSPCFHLAGPVSIFVETRRRSLCVSNSCAVILRCRRRPGRVRGEIPLGFLRSVVWVPTSTAGLRRRAPGLDFLLSRAKVGLSVLFRLRATARRFSSFFFIFTRCSDAPPPAGFLDLLLARLLSSDFHLSASGSSRPVDSIVLSQINPKAQEGAR
jgi:hypothetical protein